MNSKSVAVILVNHNGADDTIECLHSLLNSSYQNFKVILIDNNSTHENFTKLIEWSNGNYLPKFDTPASIAHCLKEDIIFPLRFKILDKYSGKNFSPSDFDPTEKYFLLRNPANSGFAVANNIGIRLAQHLNCEYFWLLNNDTVVEKNALQNLITFSENGSIEADGIIGSCVMYYNQPEIIQSLGGKFNSWTAKSYHVKQGMKLNSIQSMPPEIDCPYGASMFVSKNFISEVGEMCEDYFLFYEELDWAIRAKQKGKSVGVCLNSMVFHKQGRSTGKKMDKQASPFISCLHSRNLLFFYRKFFPSLYQIALLRLFAKAMRSFAKGNTADFKIIMKVIAGFKNCSVYIQNEK